MKRLVLSLAAALVLVIAALYYGVPSLFKDPLLQLNRKLSGLESKVVEIPSHTVHYLDSGPAEQSAKGDGIPIILLHGIFAEKDHWVDFARPLTPGHRVIAPDFPGFGQSTRRDDQPYDYAAQTARLKALMDAWGIDKAHLAGNSMGGTIAALFAIEHPGRVASLAFIGAPHGIRSPQPSDMDRLIDAGQRPLVATDANSFDTMMGLVFAKRPFLPYPILHATQEEALRNAKSNARLWDEQVKDRYLLQQQLGKASPRPTLVLWGESDRVFNVSGTQPLKGLLPANARIESLPGIGHLPMMEAPADTAGRYADFLRQAQASPASPAANPQ